MPTGFFSDVAALYKLFNEINTVHSNLTVNVEDYEMLTINDKPCPLFCTLMIKSVGAFKVLHVDLRRCWYARPALVLRTASLSALFLHQPSPTVLI